FIEMPAQGLIAPASLLQVSGALLGRAQLQGLAEDRFRAGWSWRHRRSPHAGITFSRHEENSNTKGCSLARTRSHDRSRVRTERLSRKPPGSPRLRPRDLVPCELRGTGRWG